MAKKEQAAGAANQTPTVEMTEGHLKVFQAHGMLKDGTVEDAQKKFDAMNDDDRASFLAEVAASTNPANTQAPPEVRSAEEREGKAAKQYLVKRHLMHNEKLHKAGSTVSEELFTPEQIQALLGTKTIEEVVEEEAAEEK